MLLSLLLRHCCQERARHSSRNSWPSNLEFIQNSKFDRQCPFAATCSSQFNPPPVFPETIGHEAAVQVGIVKTVGRAPSKGLGVPEGYDPVPTREEGLRKRGLVNHHLEGKHPCSMCGKSIAKSTRLLGMLIYTPYTFLTPFMQRWPGYRGICFPRSLHYV